MEPKNNNELDNQEILQKQLYELARYVKYLSKKVDILEQKLNVENNPKTKSKKNWLKDLAFYAVLGLLVFCALLIHSGNGGSPTSFAGFSAFTVLTSSMESEIPKGSLVITKRVSANDLQIGDDITYMINENTTVTHRIIGITEQYQDTGRRAFETKGVENKDPDEKIVPAANVVGKVVYHSKTLGMIAKFISNNWPFMVFVLVVVLIVGGVLKKIFKQEENTKNTQKRKELKNE